MEMFRNGWIDLGENTQMSLEQRCSTLLKIREMEIKSPPGCHFSPIWSAQVQQSDTVGEALKLGRRQLGRTQ